MSTIGGIVVRVGAEISGYVSDMKRAADLTKKASREMEDNFKTAGKSIGVAMVTAGAAVTKMVTTALQDADRFRDLSIAIGVSTEALSQLEFAAKQSGTDFDQLAKGMAKLEKATVDASKGLATQEQAFTALGLSAKSLIDLSPDEKLLAIADAAQEMGASTERTAALADIFGQRIAVGMIPFLDQGAEGIKELMMRADELGLTIGRDTADAADKFNDTIHELTQVVTGIARQITVAALPALQELAERFQRWAVESGDIPRLTQTIIDAMLALGKALAFVIEHLKGFSVAAATFATLRTLAPLLAAIGPIGWALAAGIAAGTAALVLFRSTMSEVRNGLPESQALIEEVTQAWIENADAVTRASKAAELNASLRELLVQWEKNAKAVVEYTKAFEGVSKTAREGSHDWNKFRGMLDKAEEAFKTTNRQVRETRKDIELLETATNKTAEATESFVAEIEEVEVTGKRSTEVIRDLRDWYKELRDEIDPGTAALKAFGQQTDRVSLLAKMGEIPINQMGAAINHLSGEMWDAIFAQVEWQDETVKTADDLGKLETASTGVAAVIENTWKRLDDTFAGIWSDMLSGGKSVMESLKTFFMDTLAQMLHAAITQPIVLRIGTAFAGAGGASAAFAGDGGLLSSGLGSGLLGALLGGGAGFGIGSALFGNQQAGIGGGIGGALGASLFSGISASIVGAFSASSIGVGIASSIGASAFTAIASAAVPIIGTLIGTLLGSVIGNYFARDPRISVGTAPVHRDARRSQFHDTALGGFNIGNAAGGLEEFVPAAVDAITQFDNALAAFLNEDQIGKIAGAMAGWNITLRDSAVSIENILQSRFAVVLSTFSQNVQDYVSQFEGLEAQADALAKYVGALNMLSDAIRAFIDSDPATELAEQLETAATSSTERLTMLGAALREAMAGFDETPESMQQIAALMEVRYKAEFEYLAAIQKLVQTITDSIVSQQQRIQDAIDKQANSGKTFEELFAQARELAAGIGDVASPEALASLIGGIQTLIDAAFGRLAPEDIAGGGAELIAFLEEVLAGAEARAAELAAAAVEEGAAIRNDVADFAEAFSIPLADTNAAINSVQSEITAQTSALVAEHRAEQQQAARIEQRLVDINNQLARMTEQQGRLGFVSG